MKVLFLDIDGVLASYKGDVKNKRIPYENKWSSKSIHLLNMLIDKFDLKIVLSSTWRKNKICETVDDINILFKEYGIRPVCIGKTGNEHYVFEKSKWDYQSETYERFKSIEGNVTRGYQIYNWLKRYDKVIDQIVIVDDDGDMSPYMDRLIHVYSKMDEFRVEHFLAMNQYLSTGNNIFSNKNGGVYSLIHSMCKNCNNSQYRIFKTKSDCDLCNGYGFNFKSFNESSKLLLSRLDIYKDYGDELFSIVDKLNNMKYGDDHVLPAEIWE